MKNFYKFFMTLIAFAVVGVAQAKDYVPEDAIDGIPEDGVTFALQVQNGGAENGLYLRGVGASTKIDDDCIYHLEYVDLDAQGRQRVYLVQESSGLYLKYMRVDDGLDGNDMWGYEQNCWYTDNVDEAFLLSVEVQANGTLKFWSQDGSNPSGTPTYFGMFSKIPSLGPWIAGDWLAFYIDQLPYEKLFSYMEENYRGGIEGMYVVGDAPGNVSQEAYDALEAAFNAAQELLYKDMDDVTEEEAEAAIAALEAAQQLINASVVPVKAGYYYITNTVYPSQGAYVEGSEVWHDSINVNAELSVDQSKFIWELIPAGTYGETPTFYVRNLRTGTYAGAGASGIVPSVEGPVEYLIRTRLSLVGESEGFALSPVNYPSRSWNRNGDNQRSTTVFWQAMGDDHINSYWYLTAVSDEDIAHLVDAIAQDRLNKELAPLTQKALGTLNSATYYISAASEDGLFPNALGEGAEEYQADGILVSDDQLSTNAPEANEGAPQGYTSQMVDGQNNTYFHSTWSGANEHNQDPVLDIDLLKDYNALAAKLEIRITNGASYSQGWPHTIVYYGTNNAELLLPKANALAEAGVADYEGWTELGTTTINSYPYANAEGVANVVALTDLPFGEGNEYRYLRLRFVDNQNKSGAGTTNGWKYICISELRLYEATADPASPVNKVSAATLAELKAQINAARAQLAAQTATQTQIDALQAALDAFIAELNSIDGIPGEGVTFALQVQNGGESGLYLRGVGASTKIDDECIYRFEYVDLDEQGRQRVYLVQEYSGLYLKYMRVDDGLDGNDMWGYEQNCWYTSNVNEAFLLSVEVQANGTLKFWSQDGSNPSGTPTYFGMWSGIPSLGPWISGDWLAFTYIDQLPNSSFEVTPDDPEGWNDLSRPHRLSLNGSYESPAGLEGVIDYAVEDSEDWIALTDTLASGDEFTASLVAMFDATKPTHVIKFRTRDLVGNTTMLHPIEYVDVSFHALTDIEDKTYTGDSLFQSGLICDLNEEQYSLIYHNNVNAGTASFNLEGVFPYTIGRKTYTFTINPQPLSGSLSLTNTEFVYSGEKFTPEWQFTNGAYTNLEEGKDYEIAWSDNKLPGTGSLTVSGKDNYTGSLTASFNIDKAQLTENLYSLVLPDEDVTFDEQSHGASITTAEGVGEATFTYTNHGETESLVNTPIEEGCYDVYMEIADGELYYGRPKEHIATFTIYCFDEAEWILVNALHTELTQMGGAIDWNMSDGAKAVSSFDGVSVEQGHIVGIDLSGANLTGIIPMSIASFPNLESINLSSNQLSGDLPVIIGAIKTQNPQAFANLKELNISNNNYTGNVGVLAYCLPTLVTLNASYNKFEDVFPMVSPDVTDLNISCQKIDRTVELNMSDLLIENIETKVPSILLYDHKNQTFRMGVNLLCTGADLSTFDKNTTDEWAMQLSIDGNQITIPYVSSQNAYYGESGDTLNVLNMNVDNTIEGSSFKIALFFEQGDANFVNGVDATDLQATILYAFGGYMSLPFNHTAADTYKDLNINVQDVVCTVNILLESVPATMSRPALLARSGSPEDNAGEAGSYIYIKGNQIFLHSNTPIASMSIKATGYINWNMEKYGMMQSVRNSNMVSYSLSGMTLPVNEDIVIGECDDDAVIKFVSTSDIEANPIKAAILNGVSTSIGTIRVSDNNAEVYGTSGAKQNALTKGVNIIKQNGKAIKLLKK